MLYENRVSNTISLVIRNVGSADGNGSPAANVQPSDTGLLMIGNVPYTCPIGCPSCLTASTCESCSDGFVLDSTTSTCLRCGGQCQSCSSTALSTCLNCFSGTFLASGSCNLCNVTCRECSETANNCTSCPAGLVPSGGSCVTCTDKNCIICTNAATCTICRPGFAVNSTNQCAQCISSCSICDPNNIIKCLACGYGFELVNTSCKACPAYCQTCLNGTCSQCFNGFRVTSSGNCAKQCVFPCMSCSDSDPTSCLSCSG